MPDPTQKPDLSQLPPGAHIHNQVATQFNVQASSKAVSIAFGHQAFTNWPVHFFAAVQLTVSDARWLADLLNKQIDEAEGVGADKPPTPKP